MRGYIPIGGESGQSDYFEVKEAFSFGLYNKYIILNFDIKIYEILKDMNGKIASRIISFHFKAKIYGLVKYYTKFFYLIFF